MVKLSAVLITYNEEARIARTLAALDFCDEIVVVDSGSTDATEEICRTFPVRFLTRPFDGDGPQKRFVISQAAHDWVLVVDADEVASLELGQEIRSLLERNMDGCAGFFVPISLVFLGKLLKHGGQYKNTHLRLLDRTKGNFNTNFVHGSGSVNGKTGTLHNHFLHYSYHSIHDYFEKFNAYTTAGAEALFQKGKKASLFTILLRQPITFVRIYLLRGGFLDGYPGFVWSLLSSFYPAVKWIKLREMQKRGSSAS